MIGDTGMLRGTKAAEIVVVGAAGFVGLSLLDELSDRGVSAVAAVRGAPEILQTRTNHRVMSVLDLDSRFDVVINLAYPTVGHQATHGRATANIVDQALRLVREGGRVIHVSTCAVFGPALERPVVVGPVAKARDTAYVETKIDAERRFVAAQAAQRFGLHIARLGNVVGPASPGWAAGVVRRILTGRATVVRGTPGWSNATDVRNAAAYLAFLATETEPFRGVRYHHVAEFHDAPWLTWLEPLAHELGVRLESVDASDMVVPGGLRAELTAALQQSGPRAVYHSLMRERVLGSVVRSGLTRLPQTTFDRLKGTDDMAGGTVIADPEEQIFLSIMAGVRQFPPAFAAGWTPPVSLQESVDATVEWLRSN